MGKQPSQPQERQNEHHREGCVSRDDEWSRHDAADCRRAAVPDMAASSKALHGVVLVAKLH
jgi:hypothetical protein